jgi:hypothetical protein
MSKQNGKWLVDGSVVLDKLSALVQAEINDVVNKLDASEVGVSVASLVAGKVPVAQLPNAIMEYQGTWNASTNSPTLANGAGNADEAIGNVYRVSAAGSVDFGAGAISFEVGDYVILNSSKVFEKADMSDGVVSVNSQTGVVVLDADDIDDSATTNKFATQAQLDKVDFLTVTGAVDLDQLAADSHTHSNKAILDATTASFLESHEDKLDFITVTQAVDLDDMESDIADNASAISNHLSDASDAHDASAISYVNTTSGLTATDAQAAIDEVEGRLDTAESSLSGHLNGGANKHDASEIDVEGASYNYVSAGDLESAIEDLDAQVKVNADAIAAITDPTWVVQEFVLVSQDITNEYVTLSNAPIAASVLVYPDGAPLQRASVDYSIVGTQLNFLGDLLALLEAGDVLIVKYQY